MKWKSNLGSRLYPETNAIFPSISEQNAIDDSLRGPAGQAPLPRPVCTKRSYLADHRQAASSIVWHSSPSHYPSPSLSPPRYNTTALAVLKIMRRVWLRVALGRDTVPWQFIIIFFTIFTITTCIFSYSFSLSFWT